MRGEEKGKKKKPYLWGLPWQPCREKEFIWTSKPNEQNPGAGQEAEGAAG